MKTRMTGVSLAAVVAVGLTGCGGGAKSDKSGSVPKPAKGSSVDGSKLSSSMSSAITSAKSYRQQMIEPGKSNRDTTVNAHKMSDSRTDAKVTESNSKDELLLVDNKVYAESSSLDSSSGSSKKWTKLDPKKADGMAGGLGVVLPLDGKPVGVLNGALHALDGRKVTYKGDDSKGAHYSASVPGDVFYNSLFKLIPGMSSSDKPTDLDKAKGKNVKYEMWVGKSHRPVEIDVDTTEVEAAVESGSDSPDDSVVKFVFDKWDEPVTVTAPPSSQVRDAASGGAGDDSGSDSDSTDTSSAMPSAG